MTKETQQIEIAEACGWQRREDCDFTDVDGKHKTWAKDGRLLKESLLPDYLNDLNAMQEAVLTLNFSQQREVVNQLCLITCGTIFYAYDWNKVVHATAAQRAEAFLRTKGLWVEEMV